MSYSTDYYWEILKLKGSQNYDIDGVVFDDDVLNTEVAPFKIPRSLIYAHPSREVLMCEYKKYLIKTQASNPKAWEILDERSLNGIFCEEDRMLVIKEVLNEYFF